MLSKDLVTSNSLHKEALAVVLVLLLYTIESECFWSSQALNISSFQGRLPKLACTGNLATTYERMRIRLL
jgi:hypothetical protein